MTSTDQERFRERYAQLSHSELIAIAADRKDLLPSAAIALDEELRRRGLEPDRPQRFRQPGSVEPAHSLQDYSVYRQLCAKKQSANKYRYIKVVVPFLVGVVLSETLFKRSQVTSAVMIGITMAWALLVIANAIIMSVRWAAFKCPQCGHRFGTDAECWSCAFPRNAN